MGKATRRRRRNRLGRSALFAVGILVGVLAGALLALTACRGGEEPYGGSLADLPSEEARWEVIDAAYDHGYRDGKDRACAAAKSIGSMSAAREWERKGRPEHVERRREALAAYTDPALLREYDMGYRDGDAEVVAEVFLGGNPCGLLQQAGSLFGG